MKKKNGTETYSSRCIL